MRPLLIGFIAATALLSLLVLAQQTFNQEEQESVQIQPVSVDKNKNVNQSTSLYNKLMRPLIELSGQTTEESDKKFQKIERGHLNYRRASGKSMHLPANSSAEMVAVTALHQHEPSSGRNSAQLTQSADTQSIGVTMDKIKSADSSSVRMNNNKEALAKQQQPNHDSHRNIKCTNNKYDRLIAQKISLNDLSRPIVTSDGRYDNPFPTWTKPSMFDIMKFLVFEADESNVPKNKQELDVELPLLKPTFEVQESQRNDFRVTWIGHATLLIQIDGFNILTDPVFSDRASPVQFMGPKRIREPACDIKSLPHIDIVLVSHNHYDHLDASSVIEINNRFGNECRWIVPLGIGEFLRSMSVENYVELDWWQKDCFHAGNSPVQSKPILNNNTLTNQYDKTISTTKIMSHTPSESVSRATKTNRMELDIYLTPSQHWSRRGVNDVNKSLWGSFTIVSGNGSAFFFGGDTAYCHAFKEIGKIFGPLTGAAIPIGAYKPRWFLKTSHVDPQEATQIHRDLRSMKSIAIHHSTFILSNENYMEPPKLLREAMKDIRVNDGVKEPFITLKHGETTYFCKNC